MWEAVNQTLTSMYISVREAIPVGYRVYATLFIYTLLIAIYAIFIWKFYKFLARKNILELNLSQYNRTEFPFWNKFLASALFLVEYIIIIPVVVFFWFSIFSVIILLVSESPNVNQILLISTAVIAATRIIAYYSDDLSKDIAKYFPLMLLAVFILEPNFFSASKLLTRFSEIPSLLNNILIYFLFILILEILMRGLFTLFELIFGRNEKKEA